MLNQQFPRWSLLILILVQLQLLHLPENLDCSRTVATVGVQGRYMRYIRWMQGTVSLFFLGGEWCRDHASISSILELREPSITFESTLCESPELENPQLQITGCVRARRLTRFLREGCSRKVPSGPYGVSWCPGEGIQGTRFPPQTPEPQPCSPNH